MSLADFNFSLLLLSCSFAFIIGSCIGSFMNVVIWRLPRGENLSYPPSHCPKCGHAIPPWENIPIISWLCLRARCSKCHLPISVKYPLGEAGTGLLFTALWLSILYRHLPPQILPSYFFLCSALIAVAWIDAEHLFIPREITTTGLVLALLLTLFLPQSRLVFLSPSSPDSGAMIFTGFQELLSTWSIPLASSPTLTSLLDYLLGAAMGYSLLTCVSYALSRIAAPVKTLFPQGHLLQLTPEGILQDQELTPYDELLSPGERLVIHGKFQPVNGTPQTTSKINANASGYWIDGVFSSWKTASPLSITATHLAMPRTVLGGGDIHLLAMLGAFLGADATIHILLWGALLGCLYALIRFPFKKLSLKTQIPFGPFLAFSALLWLMAGNRCYKFVFFLIK